MRETLQNLRVSLPSFKRKEADGLTQQVNSWLEKLEPLNYSCLGCKHCIPAEAMTLLTVKYPTAASSTLSSCKLGIDNDTWPPVAGEYTIVDKSAPVAVSTLASVKLEETLTKLNPPGLCMAGKTETENIGIDKIIKNIITNPAIAFLIIAGKDPEGHKSGETLLALMENGVKKDMRVKGSPGRRPVLKNVSVSEVRSFRRQVQVDNLIGCENAKIVADRVKELAQSIRTVRKLSIRKPRPKRSAGSGIRTGNIGIATSCGCRECHDQSSVPRIRAGRPKGPKLDKAGYFVIIPSKNNSIITVEQYNYENKLLRIIEGRNSRDIYRTIIDNKWITDLSHAAYIGKELARVEMAVKVGIKYVQEGA